MGLSVAGEYSLDETALARETLNHNVRTSISVIMRSDHLCLRCYCYLAIHKHIIAGTTINHITILNLQ